VTTRAHKKSGVSNFFTYGAIVKGDKDELAKEQQTKTIASLLHFWGICLWNTHSWFGLENIVHHIFVCGTP
jgi:hypothetical protein